MKYLNQCWLQEPIRARETLISCWTFFYFWHIFLLVFLDMYLYLFFHLMFFSLFSFFPPVLSWIPARSALVSSAPWGGTVILLLFHFPLACAPLSSLKTFAVLLSLTLSHCCMCTSITPSLSLSLSLTEMHDNANTSVQATKSDDKGRTAEADI